jgi:putative flippase GtrA
MITLARRLLNRYTLLNYIVVGGIGYTLNLATYYPLTVLFKTQTRFLGQSFYLPPFLISSTIAMISNYYLNKRWTFGTYKTQSVSLGRYTLMTITTIWADFLILWLLVSYGHLNPELGAAVAMAMIFLVRYSICRRWIWTTKKEKVHVI